MGFSRLGFCDDVRFGGHRTCGHLVPDTAKPPETGKNVPDMDNRTYTGPFMGGPYYGRCPPCPVGRLQPMKPSLNMRQNLVRDALARWRWANPRPALGDYFEHEDQRWTVVGFEQRHMPNLAPEMRALVLESSCHACAARYTISLPRWKLSPSPCCHACAAEHTTSQPKILPDGLPFRLHALLRDIAIIKDAISSADFTALALPLVPGRRKPQKLRQALKRMEQRGQFPEGVTLTPTGFRFD